MNILVNNYGSDVCNFRPDTTREKDSADLYPQEDIWKLAYAPVLFTRLCRAGRSIRKQFAERYFDSVSFGLLLYDEVLLKSRRPTGYADASCIDQTSYLPLPMFDKTLLGEGDNCFKVHRNGRKIFESRAGSADLVEEVLCKATAHTYIRTGDILCIELAPIRHLCSGENPETHVKAAYCGKTLLDFKIIM